MNPIIVALDGKSWSEILPILQQLKGTKSILKVNDLVFAEGIHHLLPKLSLYGQIMVDLKCHDIPNTVENTCKHLAQHYVWAVTVHASGGEEMVRAAIKGLAGSNTKALAVSVLTSLKDQVCTQIYGSKPAQAVQKLADIAFRAGADGLVCSPQEVALVKPSWPKKIYVTPGIRSIGIATNDQSRIDTPKGAIDAGSDYLVMGRQILGAHDAGAEVRRVLTEELEITV